MEDTLKNRIAFKGDISIISKIICDEYNLGDFLSNKIILQGYEDFNIILKTSNGKYFVKIFAKSRNLENCRRYIDIMLRALDAGVATPKLYKSSQGYLHKINVDKTDLFLCVMEYRGF